MTNQPQYTSGPWRLKQSQFGLFVLSEGTAERSPDAIAEMVSSGKTVQFNAHLIAAAPELLEALEMIANDYSYLLETKMRPVDADNIHRIISKAKGDAS